MSFIEPLDSLAEVAKLSSKIVKIGAFPGGGAAMRKLLMGSAAAAMLWGTAANAVPITAGSQLSTNGSDTFTSTSVSFIGAGNIGGASGSFATAFGVIPPEIVGVVNFSDFTNASTNFQLYTATALGSTSTLVAASISSFIFTPGSPLQSLDVKGTGTLTLTGFDATPGTWELTTQGPGGVATVTFSETGVTVGVSEPASGGLFASALLMTGWLYHRRRRNQQ